MREQNRSSRQQRAQHRASLTFRMNVLFFLIFIIFSALIFRLGYMQIVKGEDYVRLLQRTEEVTVNTSVPRGRILDRYGRILVDNQPENAITYTKMTSTKSAEMLEIAEQLAELIDMPTNKVTLRDKQDFWILRNADAAAVKVSKKEMDAIKAEDPEMEEKVYNAKVSELIRDRITEAELASLEGQQLEILAIYREMQTGYNLSPQIIKGEEVSDEEFARVSERLSDLPGVNTTTDWKRVRIVPIAVLGRTTTPSKGVPKEKLNYYLAREYSRNDRVGESYFESQYEDLLQGNKSVVKNVTNKAGQVVETVTTYDGEPGKDLVTTIDYELQQKHEAILEQYMTELKSTGTSQTLDRAFLVMMNPKTGEVLSMVGKKIEKDPETGQNYFIDYSYGTFTTAYEAGSSIKAATLLMGYNSGAITPGQTFVDEPITIGNARKSSLFNKNGRITIDDQYALERSSNVYMFKTVMAMAGRTYSYGMNFPKNYELLQTMRNNYSQFGLGVPTGIDLPGETTGVKGDLDSGALLLNFAIGQLDTYTPLELAQYISTVANGGYRIKPHVLKEIRNPSIDGKNLGTLVEAVEPTILNKLNNSEEQINHVKEGLRRVYIGSYGSARSSFAGATYTAAGKTGTAQVKYTNKDLGFKAVDSVNLVHVGFAPYENPEIAYAVMIPSATTNLNVSLPTSSRVARAAADAYFELKEKYEKNGLTSSSVNHKMISTSSEDLLNEEDEEKVVEE